MLKKTLVTVRNEGVTGCAKKTKGYIEKQIKKRKKTEREYKDLLFISGCKEDLPHPWRYRVKHQREQLEAYHYATDEVYFRELELDMVRYYRAFVFFRCPETEVIRDFVESAKKLNKKIIYDIDDLVIDTVYTNQIPFVASMKKEDKCAYDANVMDMQRLLKKADFAITTTGRLEHELKKYVPKVYLNRNMASEEMVSLSKQTEKVSIKEETLKVGYFSGSITHNADFEKILPVLEVIMDTYKQVELYLAGKLELPEELKKYQERIKKLPFGDWRKLPEIIAEMDINLAPLEETIFNEAKSENKWTEASLVKVVTVASDVGAFHDCIKNYETGILCKTAEDWKTALEMLIQNPQERKRIAENAYRECVNRHTTFKTGHNIWNIMEKELTKTYVFVLPGLEISGGIKVALKHAAMLQRAGKDVTLFALSTDKRWCEFDGCRFPVLSLEDTRCYGKADYMIATMWTTVEKIENYTRADHKYYLVQNFETDFYEESHPFRKLANQSYMPSADVKFLTISRWCQNWLLKDYGHSCTYAPNGLETERFQSRRRTMEGKIRILIEGDCAVEYKNVDESFEVTNGLDSEKFEIWYMSYNAQPKENYRVDRFFHKIPYEKVPEIYEQCDILLKTSLLESFSYPPLEMMATGGYVLAVPNGGNVEYLKDYENCLMYDAGNITQARAKIQELIRDKELQERLYQNGIQIAKERDWKNVEKEILRMYQIR